MDLRFYNKNILLHLVDHATTLSSSKIIKSKEPKEIIDNIFKIWIQIYGTPEKFLTDSGDKFANSQFLEMCEAMNVTVKVTAAEFPFSSGLIERHNMIITNILDKILEDQQLDLDIASSWCLNAKNSLANAHDSHHFSWYLVKIWNSLHYLMTNPQVYTLGYK